MFQGLHHIAIAVENTEDALKIWRDRFGFPVLFEEKVNQDTVLLTHLDLGNTHLQLVEPLTEGHPIRAWLKENGPGLHHLCLKVDNIDETFDRLPDRGLPIGQERPHQGSEGQRAVYIDAVATDGLRVELIGK